MKNDRIDNIISESINDYLVTEEKVADILRNGLKKLKSLKKKRNEKGPRMKKRKKAQGGEEIYDYDYYQKKNKKTSKADMDQIIDSIDQELTDIAAIARIVFPDHTEEGAQSQLRKILNRERPMTQRVARKLEELISSGAIAVKQ